MDDKELLKKFSSWRKGIKTFGDDPIFYISDGYILEITKIDGVIPFMVIRKYDEINDTFISLSNEEYNKALRLPKFKEVVFQNLVVND